MDATVSELVRHPAISVKPHAGVRRGRWARVLRILKNAAREPFFQFLLLGAVIWSSVEFVEAQSTRYVIHVGTAERQRLAITYFQQYNRLPSPEQLQALTDRWIKQQIFVREGHALGLEKDDEIVERRIAQKFEFLQQDLGAPDLPDDAVLQRWFLNHKAQYIEGPRVSFTQLYFSSDRDGDAGAQARARKALEQLKGSTAKRAPELGDAFPGPADPGAVNHDEAVRLFGESPLSEAIFSNPVGQWVGPFKSGYGWHLIKIADRRQSSLPSIATVRSRVADDYREEQRRLYNTREYENLQAKYKIVYDGAR